MAAGTLSLTGIVEAWNPWWLLWQAIAAGVPSREYDVIIDHTLALLERAEHLDRDPLDLQPAEVRADTLALAERDPLDDPCVEAALDFVDAPTIRLHVHVLHLDLHVVVAEAGQVDRQHEVVIRLDEVHRRNPALHTVGAPALRSEERSEQPVEFLRERFRPHEKRHQTPPPYLRGLTDSEDKTSV